MVLRFLFLIFCANCVGANETEPLPIDIEGPLLFDEVWFIPDGKPGIKLKRKEIAQLAKVFAKASIQRGDILYTWKPSFDEERDSLLFKYKGKPQGSMGLNRDGLTPRFVAEKFKEIPEFREFYLILLSKIR